jgi:RNA polymerase sigma-70 factor (ECF subfamily)
MLTRLTLDSHAAEDLMQDLFVKLAKAPAFKSAENPAAYVRQAAIHMALDWRRTRARQAAATAAAPQTAAADQAPPAPTAAAQQEEWARVLDASTELPGLTREAFVLHYVEQKSFVEVAQQMGKTPHQVRALCHKAIEHLRKQLTEALHQLNQESANDPQ